MTSPVTELLARFAASLGKGVVAVGWATVELDRAASQVGAALGVVPGAFEDAAPEPLLGAHCRLGPVIEGPGEGRGFRVVLLEPSTEGRLAATLARLGEGPAAAWVERRSAMPSRLSVEAVGPLGAARLVLGGPIHGPHILLLGTPAGTIRA